MLPHQPPSVTDIEECKINNIFAKLKDTLSSGNLSKYLSYVENFIAADEKEAQPDVAHAAHPDFKQHVDVWNCTHFLWRRSPKE